MTISIDLDDDIVKCLQTEARQRGMDVSAVVKELLAKKLTPTAKTPAGPPYHDLDALAGTWSEEEAKVFLSAVADFECVDEDMWK